MDTARLFRTGSSQAVRLPKEFRMPGEMVKIYRQGNRVVLEPIEPTWDTIFAALEDFPEDFMVDGRRQPDVQQREPF